MFRITALALLLCLALPHVTEGKSISDQLMADLQAPFPRDDLSEQLDDAVVQDAITDNDNMKEHSDIKIVHDDVVEKLADVETKLKSFINEVHDFKEKREMQKKAIEKKRTEFESKRKRAEEKRAKKRAEFESKRKRTEEKRAKKREFESKRKRAAEQRAKATMKRIKDASEEVRRVLDQVETERDEMIVEKEDVQVEDMLEKKLQDEEIKKAIESMTKHKQQMKRGTYKRELLTKLDELTSHFTDLKTKLAEYKKDTAAKDQTQKVGEPVARSSAAQKVEEPVARSSDFQQDVEEGVGRPIYRKDENKDEETEKRAMIYAHLKHLHQKLDDLKKSVNEMKRKRELKKGD